MHNDEGDTMQTGTAPYLACWYVKVSADTLVPMPSEKVYRERGGRRYALKRVGPGELDLVLCLLNSVANFV